MTLKRVATIMTFTFLMAQGGAFAHEGEHHAQGHKEDARMGKLHKIMPMYAQAQAKIDEALTKKDAVTVKKETGKILTTIPDLKNSRPHKNLKEIATFRKIASAFAADIEKTAALAKSGDFEGARIAF